MNRRMNRLRGLFFGGILILSVAVKAQSGYASREEAERIKNTELIVLLDTFPSRYNDAIKAAMEKYWRLGRFRFVPESEKGLYGQNDYAILACYRVEHARSLRYLSVVFPGKRRSKTESLEKKAYAYVSFDPEKINGQTIRALQFIQNFINGMLEPGAWQGGLKKTCSRCNEEKNLVHGKTLLINNSDVEDGFDEPKTISRFYPYAFRLAGREEISKAMEEQQEDIAYLMNFTDDKGLTYRLVVLAKDSKIIYCEHTLERQDLLFGKSNFRELAR